MQSALPPGVSPEQIFGGERYPVRLKMQVGDRIVLDEVYEPGGLRNEEAIYVLESWTLDPGIYDIKIWLDDSEVDLKLVYSEQVAVKAGHIQTLSFDRNREEFVAHE